jgi:hypothetical protein
MALADSIKNAIKKQINQLQLCDVVVGVVIKASPLMIEVDQRFILPPTEDAALSAQIFVLSRDVTDYKVEMSVDHQTENETAHTHAIQDTFTGGGSSLPTSHRHGYVGRKVFKVHNALKEGERVLMIKRAGSQKYYIIDRIAD